MGRRTVAVVLMAATTLPCGAEVMRRAYVDRGDGVSFSYPAGWTLNGDDDAATAKLRVALSSKAVAVVTLEGNFAGKGPYQGTDFEAGAFSYGVSPAKTEAQCFAAVDQGADATQRPVETTWNGGRAEKLEATYSIAGAEDSHQIVAAYRRGRCYLFETVIVSHSPDTADKPLAPMRWKWLRGEFESVMGSVRIAPWVGE
ncbi:hypothetical protein [Granulicella arctica]|uniref:Uncharacterized protein n=1 Tax=Granulicella arctica TaxID=940613 RepID=A0A7Y9PFM5_9BACT|nr:hypothetical protein [Granulicella arctica]NYF78261.1 hypothetical protein [Granulicella arctica]